MIGVGLDCSLSTICHVKIKKPYAHFIMKIFLIEIECKTPIGCLFSCDK